VETWDAITSRRNVREFDSRPVSREHLDRILEAARRSPSSQNSQPWDFIAVTQRERLTELSGVWQGAGHVAGSAATIALIAPLPESDHHRSRLTYDLGQATMSIMIAAADLGIGSCHSAVGDHDSARRILGYPEDKDCFYLISLGYPAARPLAPIKRPTRRPFEDVIHYDHW
jgi:nitroreductase